MTLSLWCSSTLKNGCGCGPQASPPDQPSVQTASGSVKELHSTNLGAAGQFSLPPKGLEEGVLHVIWILADVRCRTSELRQTYDIV